MFALQSVPNYPSRQAGALRSFTQFPPLGWIANSASGAADLKALGCENVYWTYRPPPLRWPDYTSPPTPESHVHWYWKAGHPPLLDYQEFAIETMAGLPKVKFHVFPTIPFVDAQKTLLGTGR